MASWLDASSFTFESDPEQLSLPGTLDCGQAFRWRLEPDGWWTGVVRGRALRLRREGGSVEGQLFPPADDAQRFAASYLRLDVELGSLRSSFAEADSWMAEAVATFPGVRVLSQEPAETLLSYICSTANSVPRISCAVEAMSRRYGSLIGTLDGTEHYAFPTVEALAEASPEELWSVCRLGWRGNNLIRVAGSLLAKPPRWPEQLRVLPYREAKAALMEVYGIGAKIADCICLFALEKDEAVPVDTHIWALAREIFDAQVPTRTLTPATYDAIAGLFVGRYGVYAGWAQEYLYLWRRAKQGRVPSVRRG